MTDMRELDDRTMTAYHEAGHAVASVMRGGSELRSVTLTPGHPDHRGQTWHSSAPWDAGFIAWAGPWAQARASWGDLPLDGEDDDLLTFDDYLVGAVLTGGHEDAAAVEASHEQLAEQLAASGLPADPAIRWNMEHTWSHELERAWPAVQSVAGWLTDGRTVTDELVRGAWAAALQGR